MMQMATGILGGTPPWVWVLLAVLVWLGAQSLRLRTVPLRRVAILPVVFLVWGLSGVAGRPFPADTIAVMWLGGFAAGLLLGLATGPQIIAADHDAKRLRLPASIWPLARNMFFFFAHYALNVAAAILAARAAMLLQADIAVSGLSAGYFIGWGIVLWRRYRTAPDMALTASAA